MWQNHEEKPGRLASVWIFTQSSACLRGPTVSPQELLPGVGGCPPPILPIFIIEFAGSHLNTNFYSYKQVYKKKSQLVAFFLL